MESNEGKQSRVMVPFLLVVIAGLLALNFYQNSVIRNQSVEIRWLMHQGIVLGGRPAAAPASPGVVPQPAGTPSGQNTAHP
jgi:hypothetical protein